MAFFPQVVKGESFKPNILLENSVRRMVNAGAAMSGEKFTAVGNSVLVPVYNASNAFISAMSAVNFSGDLLDEKVAGCIPFFSDGSPWGVVVSMLSPGDFGSCVISGPVAVNYTGEGEYLAPSASSPDIFVAGAAGQPILGKSDSQSIALIALGVGSSVALKTSFQLTIDNGNVKIINGKYPDYLYCGTAYFFHNYNGENVPVTTLPLKEDNIVLWAIATRDERGHITYSVKVDYESNPPPGYFDKVMLGSISTHPNSVEQRYYDSYQGTINFYRDWFL